MKKTILLLLYIPTFVLAQTRNDKVRELNRLVQFMNEVQFWDNSFYFDISSEFCDNLCTNYLLKNEAVFSFDAKEFSIVEELELYNDAQKTTVKLSDISKQVKIDSKGMGRGSVRYLHSKWAILDEIKNEKIILSTPILITLNNYMKIGDEVVANRLEMTEYIIHERTKDTKLKKAYQLAAKTGITLKKHRNASMKLYNAIKNEYEVKYLTLPNIQGTILKAAEEMNKIILLKDEFHNYLYSHNKPDESFYRNKIKKQGEASLAKESVYFTNSYAYKSIPNSRTEVEKKYFRLYTYGDHIPYKKYSDFYKGNILKYDGSYGMSSSNLSFGAQDTIRHQYNYLVREYNEAIRDYNSFIAFAGGEKNRKIIAENNIFAGLLDTSENVLLNKPSILNEFTCPCAPKLVQDTITKTALFLDIELAIKRNEKEIVSNEPQTQQPTIDIDTKSEDQKRINKALPHHLVYLLDTSNSMNVGDKMSLVKSNAKYLLGLQRKTDKISLLIFADKTSVLLENKSCNLKEEIEQTIDNLKAKGGTNINQGIEYAIQIASQNKLPEGKNKILLYTDGAFSISQKSEQLLLTLQEAQINFSIVYLGNSFSKGNAKNFESLCERAKIKFYNINKTNLKEILMKEATE
jgi:Mg-chelatase subunit ChlD